MELKQQEPITSTEIAEVVDLINELNQDSETREQSLALCRSVIDLMKVPDLSLHGILTLIQAGKKEDVAALTNALENLGDRHKKVRWIQFRCGHHFGELGLFQQGIACYQQSISLRPTVKSHLNIARLYKKLMDFEPAILHYEDALVLNPDSPKVCEELLYLMAMKGDLDRFNQLVAGGNISAHSLANSYNRLGQTLVYQGDRERAMSWFDKAVEIRPDSFSFQWSKQLTISTIYRTEQDLVASRKQYLTGLESISKMFDQLGPEEKKQAHRCAEKLTNFEIHYQSENDMEVQRPYGALFNSIMQQSFGKFMQPMVPQHPGDNRRIRVGFASWGCFFTHSNYKTHGAWITDLNSERFEVFGYPLSPYQDQATTRMSQLVENYRPFVANVGKIRQQILEDQLDILVYPGIGMEPVVHKLAPLRLAPVQCTSWGHPVTSGLPSIDYYLSSELMEPKNGQEHYSETLIQLPNLGISQIPPGLPDQYRAPAALEGRPRPKTVFLCSQNVLKMMPRHDYLFGRILQAVPDSEIWFIQSKRADINQTFRDRLENVCESYGLNFAQQCLMLPRLGKAEFCYVNEHADVMLDTSFWSGCNTTFETLVHGTPVITMPGNTMRGRHTWAILKLHGLDQLICQDEAEYVSLATRLATDPVYYAEVKNHIDQIRDNLFGDPVVIQALEQFFEDALKSG